MGSLRESEVDGSVEQRTGEALEVFSACPASMGIAPKPYLKKARDIARWSERNGCRGAVVHADHRRLDPWLVSQVMVQSTRAFSPLVTVHPASAHPFTVANMIATFASLYGRRLYINWVGGGVTDDTPHDERYDRLVEFAAIVRHLTDGGSLTFEGRYYEARRLQLRQPVDPAIRPVFLVSGSSPAGRSASQTLGARAVTYALPPDEQQTPPVHAGLAAGLRLGIIARADKEEAWRAAYTRFFNDPKSLARHLPHESAGSHDDIPRLAAERAEVGAPYWTRPFESYQAMCPYLVGSHEEVSAALARYVKSGFGTFILDESESETDLENTRVVFDYARKNVMEAA